MMEFIHEPFEHPYEHPFHHHHHEVNPIELAQIGGASQYAKLSYRLQKHVEDDTRHITDEERYKWNKASNDLKALKEDIDDGTIGGGNEKTKLSEFINDVPYVTEANLIGRLGSYATQDWVNLMLKNVNPTDSSNYIKTTDTLFWYGDQRVMLGDHVNPGSGNNGLTWNDLKSGLTYNAFVKSNTSGAQAIGEIKANGELLFTIYQTDFVGEGGATGDLRIATLDTLGGIKAGEPYSASINNATRYGVQVDPSTGRASVVVPNNQSGQGETVAGDVYNWNPFFTLYPSNNNSDKPQLPNPTTNTWTYGSYTWTDDAPNGNDDYFVWMCLVEYKNSSPTGNVNGPVCLGGDPGADANGIEFVYRRWQTENAVDVVGNLHSGITNDGKTPADEDYVPSDWTDHPTGINEQYRYEYMACRTSTLVNNRRVWSNNFSEPWLWSKWGQDGTDGDGVEFIFSTAVDITTTQANMKTQLNSALTQVFGSNYTLNDEYQHSNEVANVIINGKSLDSLGWHDNAPQIALGQCVYVSIRKKRWNSTENEVVWGEFSDPVIWSAIPNITGGGSEGTLYYLTVTPTQIHVDSNGDRDANKIYARLYCRDENGTAEMNPTTASGDYILYYQFSNEETKIAFNDSAYTANGYELTLTDASSVTISATNTDGVQLCQSVTVSQVVDGSVVYGADAIDVNVRNDVLAIGCDSDNKITSNISNEEVYVYAHIGNDSIISDCRIRYNNQTIQFGSQNGRTVTAVSNIDSNNGFSAVIKAEYDADNDRIKLTVNTNLNPSNFQLHKSYNIPLELYYAPQGGQTYTRPFSISIIRINSGAPGVAPTLYKLIVNKDTINVDKNSSGNNIFNDTLPITGHVEMSSVTGIWGKVKISTSSTLKLRAVGIDGSTSQYLTIGASVFSYTSDGITWQYNPASLPANIYNAWGNHFLIQLGNSDFSTIYDQEVVDFVFNGKDGSSGVQGLQGCIVRESLIDDGTSTTKYRNDSNWSTSSIRYVDVIGVSSSTSYANEDGFEWFVVKPSGTTSSVESQGCRIINWTAQLVAALKAYVEARHSVSTHYGINIPENFEYLNNVGGIYSSFILAKNAKIKFQTSNELTIVGRDNSTIVAGLTGGGNSTNNVRIWAGSTESDTNDAPFRVYEDGSLVAQNAEVVGQIDGSNGHFNTTLTGPKGSFVINSDGSGYVAFGNIKWHADGSVEIANATFIDCYGMTGDIISGGGGEHVNNTVTKGNVVISNYNFTNNQNDITKVDAKFNIRNNNSVAVKVKLTLWSEAEAEYVSDNGNLNIPYWTAVKDNAIIQLNANQTLTDYVITYPKSMVHDDDYSSQPLNGKRDSGDIVEASWINITSVESTDAEAKPMNQSNLWPD